MKSLPDCMSPRSWMILTVACYVPLAIILEPSLRELLILLGIEMGLVLILNRWIEGQVFTLLFPDTRTYFYLKDYSVLQSLKREEKVRLVQSFLSYPSKRASFCYFWAFIKVIPALWIMTQVWNYERTSTQQLTLTLLVTLVNWSFFHSMVWTHSHVFLSQKLRELHDRFDWSDVFVGIKARYSRKDFVINELLGIVYLFFSVIVLQAYLLLSPESIFPYPNSWIAIAAGMLGLSLYLYNYFMSRTVLTDAFYFLVHAMEQVNFRRDRPFSVAPHTLPLLTPFEQAFNSLSRRLTRSEAEVRHYVARESEKSRYEVLGEISALIAHDLSTPLHTAHFCAKEIEEQPERAHNPKYQRQLVSNLERSVELIRALRERIKNPNGERECDFQAAHENVVALLSTQYGPIDFPKIQFAFDSRLTSVRVGVGQVVLIQILDNFYRNAVQNLLTNKIASPQINIDGVVLGQESIVIRISDNGTGLSESDYRKMIEMERFSEDYIGKASMGLRLTKSLIEQNGGTIELLGLTKSGTAFQLTLPRASMDGKVWPGLTSDATADETGEMFEKIESTHLDS